MQVFKKKKLVCEYMNKYISVCTRIYVYMYGCMYICMYVYIYIYAGLLWFSSYGQCEVSYWQHICA